MVDEDVELLMGLVVLVVVFVIGVAIGAWIW